MELKIGKTIQNALNRAALSVGVITSLVTIGVFGLAALAFGAANAGFVAVTTFGFIGALEVFHRQEQAEAIRRSKMPRRDSRDDLLLRVPDVQPTWHAKTFKEFIHGGLKWRGVGFQEAPVPVTVAGPMCPRCGNNLTERLKVRFPGRTRIDIACLCGFTQRSAYTIAELKTEARELAGTIVED